MTRQPQPQKPSKPAQPPRPSLQQILDNIDKWANSPGLQPPK